MYREVDVMESDQAGWRNLYEFDTPVVGPIASIVVNSALKSDRSM